MKGKTMNEAIIILLNMRGGCATVGNKVHTLFRVKRNPRPPSTSEKKNMDSEVWFDRPPNS
jgi:hypothetical protein